MSNILYIGPYREFSGIGNAARNYIKSLVFAGYNVSIRPIYNTFKSYPDFDIDNDILELENNFQKKYHTVIQHCYPHQYYLDSRFDQTIGICHLESTNYYNRLDDYINIPDKIIVPSKFVKNSILESNKIDKSIFIIPIPIDINSINEYKNTRLEKDNKSSFSFYVIADFINKNNILEILEAFLLGFADTDDIDLIIKTKNKTQEHDDLYKTIEYELVKLKNKLGIHHKKPKIIIGETKKEAIYYLHNNNHCYVDISSGKSFGYSILEAMCFNNSIITLNNSTQSELIENTENFVVDSNLVNCRDESRAYDIYNTFDQKWLYPSMNNLILKLRQASLEETSAKLKRHELTKNKLNNYTIESIANKFKEYDI